MDRIIDCRPEAGQPISHRLRRRKQSGEEVWRDQHVIICDALVPRSGYVFQAAHPERTDKSSC